VYARPAVRPAVQAAITIREWSSRIPTSLSELVAELSAQSAAASAGNLERSEAMLMSQAHTRDAIANNLARSARANMKENFDAFETLLRLAFKAQSRFRAMLETLAEIKYARPVAFVRQANIANGPQQVNNDAPGAEQARAGEKQKRAKQTFGGSSWRTAGRWNGEPSSQQRSDNGDRGNMRPGLGPLTGSGAYLAMLIAGIVEAS
jgi:hypothetical protein